MEGTSCPSGTKCLNESSVIIQYAMNVDTDFDYFVTTISIWPSLRRTLMPTSCA